MNAIGRLFQRVRGGARRIPSTLTSVYLRPLNRHQKKLQTDPARTYFPLDSNGQELFGQTFRVGTEETYLVGLYDHESHRPRFTERNYYLAAEVLPGSLVKQHTVIAGSNMPCSLPIANLHDDQETTVVIGTEELVFSGPKERFVYASVPANTEVTVSPRGSLAFLGTKIPWTDPKSVQVPRVLCLFVCGLSNDFLGNGSFASAMPATSEFFGGGLRFTNFATSGEWTLPGQASAFTAQYPHNHQVLHPRTGTQLNPKTQVLSEYFQRAGYLTSQFGGLWRMTPSHGYARGFDRTIYRREASASWLVEQHLAFISAFKERGHFSWISFGDLHRPWPRQVPSIDIQLQSSNEYLFRTPYGRSARSLEPGADPKQVEAYQAALRLLDSKLSYVYERITSDFADNDFVVAVYSDHGQVYFRDDFSILGDQRTLTPFLVKAPNIAVGVTPELVETVDVAPSLLFLSGLTSETTLRDGHVPVGLGGPTARCFTTSQTIYPGKPYQCRIRDQKDWIEFGTREAVTYECFIPVDSLYILHPSRSGAVGGQPDDQLLSMLVKQLEEAGMAMRRASL